MNNRIADDACKSKITVFIIEYASVWLGWIVIVVVIIIARPVISRMWMTIAKCICMIFEWSRSICLNAEECIILIHTTEMCDEFSIFRGLKVEWKRNSNPNSNWIAEFKCLRISKCVLFILKLRVICFNPHWSHYNTVDITKFAD